MKYSMGIKGILRMDEFELQIEKEGRFEFGRNWSNFLSVVDDERIGEARDSLRQMLDGESLIGKRFLDVGSGSGLYSLAARSLGMSVHSFDFDPQSVACTNELKRLYRPEDSDWSVDKGSILDSDYVRSLGEFDIVYAWGVLHHTGNLRLAMEQVLIPVAPGGRLFVSIYNHQVYWTTFNVKMKRAYSQAPSAGKWAIVGIYTASRIIRGLVKDFVLQRNPTRRYRDKKKLRGMSTWHDWIDWVGGYPFEAAKPEEVFDFYKTRGFTLVKMKTWGGGHGCNEFVFVKSP